jgi:hypothetical protein
LKRLVEDEQSNPVPENKRAPWGLRPLGERGCEMNMIEMAKSISYGQPMAGARRLHELRKVLRSRLQVATENRDETEQEFRDRISARSAIEAAYYNGRISALKDILTDLDCMGA